MKGQPGPPQGIDEQQPPRTPADERRGFWRELPVLVLVALALALVIKTFLVQAFYIPSGSMVPTLEQNDRVLVNKLVYRLREPKRGEVVVFVARHGPEERSLPDKIRTFLFEGLGVTTPRDTDFIKRVIALPGETVHLRNGRVTVTTTSGRRMRLEEGYVADQPDDSDFGPYRVPDGFYFVMGDNRPNSSDSRSALGPVRRSDIVGKAFVRIWPLDRLSLFRRPAYR